MYPVNSLVRDGRDVFRMAIIENKKGAGSASEGYR